MRIDGTNPWSGMEGVASQKAEGTKADNSSSTSVVTSAGDEARVSHEGTLASRLYQQLNAVPEVRQARVDQLRQAINQGTYAVSADQIVTALQNDMRGFRSHR